MPTVSENVAASRSPQEALLVIAAALDRIEARIERLEDSNDDVWAAWSVTPEPFAEAQPARPVELPDVDTSDVDPAMREHLDEARARLANDDGASVDLRLPEGQAPQVTVSDEQITVDLPPPTDEQRQERLAMAYHLKLDDAFGQEGLDDTYVQGGPLWLWLTETGRDFILQLPYATRQAMVRDVMQTSPARAHDFGLDVLAARTEDEVQSIQRVAEDDFHRRG